MLVVTEHRRIFLVDFNLIMAELVQVIHNVFISFVVVSTENVFQKIGLCFFGCLIVSLKIGRIYLSWFVEYVTFWNIGLVFC